MSVGTHEGKKEAWEADCHRGIPIPEETRVEKLEVMGNESDDEHY